MRKHFLPFMDNKGRDQPVRKDQQFVFVWLIKLSIVCGLIYLFNYISPHLIIDSAPNE